MWVSTWVIKNDGGDHPAAQLLNNSQEAISYYAELLNNRKEYLSFSAQIEWLQC